MTVHIIHLEYREDRKTYILGQSEFQGISDFRFWPGIHAPEKPSRGIAQAHQQIIRWAKSEGENEVIIAEDDLQFTGPGAFKYFTDHEPENYDLYLGGISYGKLKSDNSVDDFAATHLYKIKSRFFDTMLALTGEKDIDRDLAHRGRFIVCDPMVAIQCDGYSDNSRKHQNNSIYWKGRELWTGSDLCNNVVTSE